MVVAERPRSEAINGSPGSTTVPYDRRMTSDHDSGEQVAHEPLVLDLDELAKRLHNGPLQAFFAALMVLEADVDGRDAKLNHVLETGADELRAIISELRSRAG